MIYFIVVGLIIVILAIYLFAIAPNTVQRMKNTKLGARFYAHRGLHDNETDAPENSMHSFGLAIESGYGIEFDVQLTKDDQVVVFHDESLKRACGQIGNVRDYTYKELQSFPLFMSEERIPLFLDVLHEVDGKVPLIIEIKIHENVEKVCSKVNEVLKNYRGEYVIESFHPLAVKWYRTNRPDIIRGQLSSNFRKDEEEEYRVSYFFVQHLLFNFLTRPDFIAYSHKYRNAMSLLVCRNLFKASTVAWTIRSQNELYASMSGFDLFIFEGFIPVK